MVDELLSVEAVQTAGRAHPDESVTVLDEGLDRVGRQSVPGGIVAESPFGRQAGPGEGQQQKEGKESLFHHGPTKIILFPISPILILDDFTKELDFLVK